MWWWLTFCSATVMVKGSNPTSFTKESECSQGSLCYAVHKVQREYVKKYPSSRHKNGLSQYSYITQILGLSVFCVN